MRNYSNAERLWYNFKADLRWWRKVLFGTPWSEIEGNENKKKPCLFIRFLDCISRDVEEGGHYVASLIMLWVLGFKYPFNSSYSI